MTLLSPTKLFALALALLVGAPLASAQVPAPGSFQAGVKGGLNTAWQTGDAIDALVDETQPRLGLAAGLVGRYNVTPSFAFQLEALYSQKGVTTEDDALTSKIDYVEIPVLARVSVPLSPLLNAGAYVGPSIGIPVNDEVDYDLPNIPETDTFDPATDLGATIGVDIGSGPFFVDARYTFGLSNPYTGEIEDPEDQDELNARNQNVQFTFGYWF